MVTTVLLVFGAEDVGGNYCSYGVRCGRCRW